jgi:hypothetical protein
VGVAKLTRTDAPPVQAADDCWTVSSRSLSARPAHAWRRTEMNESYAVGWSALALINVNIAQLKGRSGFVFGFLSLIGGPIVTLVLVFVEARPK